MTALPSLMPAFRLRRAAARRRRSAWATALTLYGLVTAAVCVPSMYRSGARYLAASDDTARLRAAIDERRASQASAARRADAARARWQAAASLSSHPDWSVLFPYLAAHLAHRATLSAVDVQPVGGIDEQKGYVVRLSGRAADAAAVSRIALDLETSGPFDAVIVEGSSRTADGGVTFTLRAPITGGRGREAAP